MQLAIGVSLKSSAWAEANANAIWRAVHDCASRGYFTAQDIAQALRTQRVTDLRRFLMDACAAQLLHSPQSGRFILAARTPHAKVESVAGRRMQQMWNVLRGPQARRGIAAAELALLSSTDDVPVSTAQATRYLAALAASHFVRAQDGGSFRLPPDRNTGPQAPRLMRADFVIDPNGLSVSASPILAEEVSL